MVKTKKKSRKQHPLFAGKPRFMSADESEGEVLAKITAGKRHTLPHPGMAQLLGALTSRVSSTPAR